MKIKVWTWPIRVMHFAMVGAFIVAMVTRDSEMMRDIHVDSGYIAGIALVSRLVYGFLAGDFGAFRRFPFHPLAGLQYLVQLATGKARRYLGHNPAGAVAIYAMLLLGLATVASGLLSFNQVSFSFMDTDDGMQSAHAALAELWVVVVAGHVTGVLIGSLVHRENLIASMITGLKARRIHVASVDWMQKGLISLLMAFIRVIDFLMVGVGMNGIVLRADRDRYKANHSTGNC